jgi:hypothetical protein
MGSINMQMIIMELKPTGENNYPIWNSKAKKVGTIIMQKIKMIVMEQN